jgi:hypothetical protein
MPSSKPRLLQVHEDLQFERGQWRVQRASWLAIAVILLLALLGVFGGGPVSHARIARNDGVLNYDRFVHANSPTTVRAVVAPSDGTARVAFDRAYLEAMPVDHVRPNPIRVQVSEDSLVYYFEAPAPRSVEVAFDLRPQEAGRHEGTVRLGTAPGAPPIRYWQFVYP